MGGKGVSFPPGSSISYEEAASRLVMRNTPENTEVFERVLAALNVVPNQVEIDVSFVAFDLKLVEEVARKAGRTTVSGEEIKALWREGKGRLIGTSKAVTRCGINAASKGVDEVIYPTEYTSARGTNGAAGVSDPIPGTFLTRELGIIVNSTPTVGPDGHTIDVTFVPEFCELLFHDNIGVEKTQPDGKKTSIQFRQPRFHSRNLTTSLVMLDGETLVAGAMPNSGVTEITYVLVTARLLDPSGSRLGKSAWGRTIRTETNASATHQTIETRRLPVSRGLPNLISELQATRLQVGRTLPQRLKSPGVQRHGIVTLRSFSKVWGLRFRPAAASPTTRPSQKSF